PCATAPRATPLWARPSASPTTSSPAREQPDRGWTTRPTNRGSNPTEVGQPAPGWTTRPTNRGVVRDPTLVEVRYGWIGVRGGGRHHNIGGATPSRGIFRLKSPPSCLARFSRMGPAMSQPRHILPGATYLITRRILRRHFLLRPDSAINQILLYVLAVSADLYGIQVHAFCAMSTHYHLVATDVQGVLPHFLRDFHRIVSLC